MDTLLSELAFEREKAEDVRTTNVNAVMTVANVLKTSLGPKGLDKLLVDEVGDVLVTNDGATILKKYEITHPIARVLADLASLQDQEVGDGTTSVVLIAAELLKKANMLVRCGTHPTTIITGYKLAMKEATSFIKQRLAMKMTASKDMMKKIASTSLNSKYIGTAADHFSDIVADALTMIQTKDSMNRQKFNVNSINIVKSHGRSVKESYLFDGYILSRVGRASTAMPQVINGARVALLDFNLRQHRMQLGVQVEITDPQELEKVREKERDITKKKIQQIIDAGANVILTTQGIDDMAMKYFVNAKCMAIRRVDRQDMKRLSRCLNAHICLTMADMHGEEKFLPTWLGRCQKVYEDNIGDWSCIFFENCSLTRSVSIVLRGPNEPFLEEAERSMHDALCAASKACESEYFWSGGGAIETAVSVHLEKFSRTLGSRESLAVAEFADSLLIIPRTLAVNAGLDSLDIVGELCRVHLMAQSGAPNSEEKSWARIDYTTGNITDKINMDVIEPTISKVKMIRFATEAAITIIRIDDVITVSDRPQHQARKL